MMRQRVSLKEFRERNILRNKPVVHRDSAFRHDALGEVWPRSAARADGFVKVVIVRRAVARPSPGLVK